jgi:hypothetical protein
MRKLHEPCSIYLTPTKPAKQVSQATTPDLMSFKFLVTINSQCTTVELALSVDGLLKNVGAQHLPDTL